MKRFLRLVWPYILCALFVLAVLWSAMLMVGCTTTKFVEVEKVVRDTTYIKQQQRDSVWLHDSVFVERFFRGDTVFELRDRWHTKFVERLRVDTMVRVRVDSVPKPYPVEKLVEMELSWWQRFRLFLGNVSLVALLGVLGYGGWRLYRLWRIG